MVTFSENKKSETQSHFKKQTKMDWRDGSSLKTLYCSRRTQLGSQHPQWAAHNHLRLQLQEI